MRSYSVCQGWSFWKLKITAASAFWAQPFRKGLAALVAKPISLGISFCKTPEQFMWKPTFHPFCEVPPHTAWPPTHPSSQLRSNKTSGSSCFPMQPCPGSPDPVSNLTCPSAEGIAHWYGLCPSLPGSFPGGWARGHRRSRPPPPCSLLQSCRQSRQPFLFTSPFPTHLCPQLLTYLLYDPSKVPYLSWACFHRHLTGYCEEWRKDYCKRSA